MVLRHARDVQSDLKRPPQLLPKINEEVGEALGPVRGRENGVGAKDRHAPAETPNAGADVRFVALAASGTPLLREADNCAMYMLIVCRSEEFQAARFPTGCNDQQVTAEFRLFSSQAALRQAEERPIR